MPAGAEHRDDPAAALGERVLDERVGASRARRRGRRAARRGAVRNPLRRRVDLVEPEPRDRLALPLRAEPLPRADLDGVLHERVRRRADQDRPRLGGLLEPLGEIHRVAGDERLSGTRVARDDLAGVDRRCGTRARRPTRRGAPRSAGRDDAASPSPPAPRAARRPRARPGRRTRPSPRRRGIARPFRRGARRPRPSLPRTAPSRAVSSRGRSPPRATSSPRRRRRGS